MNDEQHKQDIIDTDLYEEIDDEEMYRLVKEAQKEALEKEQEEKNNKQSKRPFPKWMFWLIAFALAFHVMALLPQTFSIPAIDFLITSAKLSTDDTIKTYKKAVVVIETGDSRGTGFSIDEKGTIITNDHVVDNEEQVTVAFSKHGLFRADVIETYPEIDLAILQVREGENLPYLTLADKTTFTEKEKITFIGNPLRFQGIANEGEVLEYIQLDGWDDPVVMIDAPVYRGNSGSPIINGKKEVIGVVFATLDHEQHGNVGLFIPIDYFYR